MASGHPDKVLGGLEITGKLRGMEFDPRDRNSAISSESPHDGEWKAMAPQLAFQ